MGLRDLSGLKQAPPNVYPCPLSFSDNPRCTTYLGFFLCRYSFIVATQYAFCEALGNSMVELFVATNLSGLINLASTDDAKTVEIVRGITLMCEGKR